MLRVKTATKYQALSLLKAAAIVLLVMLAFALVAEVTPTQYTLHAFGGVALALVLALVLYLMRNSSKFRWKHFACPDCKLVIESPLENSSESGEPILYHCQNCQVLWFAGHTARD
jgi:hypothetical protein